MIIMGVQGLFMVHFLFFCCCFFVFHSLGPTHFKAVVRYRAGLSGSPSCTLQIHKPVPSCPNPSELAKPSCFLLRHSTGVGRKD